MKRIHKAINYAIIRDKVPLLEKFEQSKRAGYDGMSLMHPAPDIDLDDIAFTGWATAEVQGGDENRLREVAANMDRALGLG